METDTDDTAAWARIEDVAACAARVDAQVRVVLGRVLAQRRSAEVASGYVSALSPGTKANCWSIAEAVTLRVWDVVISSKGNTEWLDNALASSGPQTRRFLGGNNNGTQFRLS